VPTGVVDDLDIALSAELNISRGVVEEGLEGRAVAVNEFESLE